MYVLGIAMAALPSEEDLEYLWRPKRTLRDWGETNYNIVRNWTPHNKKLALPNGSPTLTNKSKASVTKFSPTKKPSISTKLHSAQTSFQGELSTSYRLRRNTRKQQGAASSESSWYIPNDSTANRGSTSFGSFKQNSRDRSGLLNDETSKSKQIHSDASMSSSESPSGAHLSHTSDQQLLSPDSKDTHAHVASQEDGSYSGGGGGMSGGEEQGAPVQRPDNEDRDDDFRYDHEDGGNGEGGMATEEETDPMDCEDMDTDALLPPSSRSSRSAGLGKQQVSSRAKNRMTATNRGKRPASKPRRSSRKKFEKETLGEDNESIIKVKLWQLEDAPQTAEDLSELDPCPTLYDRIINEAGAKPGNEVVQNALVNSWDGTQKQNLPMIEDLRNVTILEERLKEEKTKHTQLQKEMLKSLQRSNGEYHKVLMKAKGDKRRREKKAKHSHLQKEMHDVLQSLRRSNGEFHEALVKAKGDKQRQETQDVECQIAAVGLLLQSNLSS